MIVVYGTDKHHKSIINVGKHIPLIKDTREIVVSFL